MNDLISREEAIKAVKFYETFCDPYPRVIEALEDLPSAQPRKGKWIETEFLKLRECSCCHVRWGMYDVENFDFCPNCGCRMEEGDSE